MTVTDIANEIYKELGEPSDAAIPAIAFWLLSNIGKLNNLLDTEYFILEASISPDLGESEKTIYKLLYEIAYYNRQVNKNLGAAAYTSIMEVKEGNRTVKRTNKNDVAKTYRSVVGDLNSDLEGQVLSYKMNRADPLQIIVANPILVDPLNPYRDRDETRFDLL